MIGMLNIRQYMDFYFRIAYRSVLYRSSAHQGTNQVCMTWISAKNACVDYYDSAYLSGQCCDAD